MPRIVIVILIYPRRKPIDLMGGHVCTSIFYNFETPELIY
jgi:hypothetical protein